MPSGGGSSATSTTVPSRGSWRWRRSSGSRARRPPPRPRLGGLAASPGLARGRADGRPEVAVLLDESVAELRASLDELRELARGIHPAVLTDRGLDAALVSLVTRAPLPVELAGPAPADLPASVQTAIYFVVAEALTNVAKYADAGHATVLVQRRP